MGGTNHYGHFLLQALLYPLIEKSKGRIVVVGSMGYNMGIKTIQFDDMNWDKNYHANNVYSQSKLAQIMSMCLSLCLYIYQLFSTSLCRSIYLSRRKGISKILSVSA